MVQEALHYMRFATAVYGWQMFLWLNRLKGALGAGGPGFVLPPRICAMDLVVGGGEVARRLAKAVGGTG